ncbi:MAG: hypothetical protein ACRDRL_27660, partial [Sciscionella sp.]
MRMTARAGGRVAAVPAAPARTGAILRHGDQRPRRRRTVKTKAAIITEPHKPFELVELDLDGPQANEVLIRYVAAGLCHSDLHL